MTLENSVYGRGENPGGAGPDATAGAVQERELGRGGMGVVYLAPVGRFSPGPVAVKRLPARAADESGLAARLRREGELISGLRHPHIIRVFGIHEDRDCVSVEMEHCEIGSLAQLVARAGPFTAEGTIALLRSIGGALAYLHRKGILHLDVKPSNILFCLDGRPKLADFGLSVLRQELQTSMTASSVAVGTPGYMAPELRLEGGRVTEQADVYSLGATAYFCLTGENPTVIRESRIPPELRGAVLRALEERPERRHATLQEFVDALRAVPLAPPAAPAVRRVGVLWGRVIVLMAVLMTMLAVSFSDLKILKDIRLHSLRDGARSASSAQPGAESRPPSSAPAPTLAPAPAPAPRIAPARSPTIAGAPVAPAPPRSSDRFRAEPPASPAAPATRPPAMRGFPAGNYVLGMHSVLGLVRKSIRLEKGATEEQVSQLAADFALADDGWSLGRRSGADRISFGPNRTSNWTGGTVWAVRVPGTSAADLRFAFLPSNNSKDDSRTIVFHTNAVLTRRYNEIGEPAPFGVISGVSEGPTWRVHDRDWGVYDLTPAP